MYAITAERYRELTKAEDERSVLKIQAAVAVREKNEACADRDRLAKECELLKHAITDNNFLKQQVTDLLIDRDRLAAELDIARCEHRAETLLRKGLSTLLEQREAELSAARADAAHTHTLWAMYADAADRALRTFSRNCPLPPRPITSAARAALSAEGPQCENGLLPDGPVCPRCGGPRGPSGVDGGSWVHMLRATPTVKPDQQGGRT